MAKANSNSVGTKLRKCRINCGFSQQQVAKAIGVERSTYTCYENGRFQPKVETIMELAKIFRVNFVELLPSEGNTDQLSEPDDENVIQIFSLKKDEQDLIIAYRSLKNEQKSEILAKTNDMLKQNN
ncbi:MAG: helix-turn-helix domain-containing protein [Ruminococcus sp.]|nr:helix-turn-helix domain-containing protein [Ruminococcus sp.]